jgi:hypothetical protein
MEYITFDRNSNIIRVFLLDSTSTVGAGLAGLTYASSGLVISVIANNSPTATVYTVAANHIEDITTLGTYQAPSTSCCRFKEVDATNHKGLYEIQLADAIFSPSNAVYLDINVYGATNLVQQPKRVMLNRVDWQDSVREGLTALPNAAAEASGGLFTRGTGTGQINQDSNGRIDTNETAVAGTTANATILAASLALIKSCTVDTANFSPTSTDFETSSISDATENVYKDKSVYFTSGNLIRQAKLILSCSLISGKVHITTAAFTGAPANTDSFFIA